MDTNINIDDSAIIDDVAHMYINNLKSVCYEVNNIDSMARTKIVLIDDEIKWLRKVLHNLLKNYATIVSKNFE